jgi:hypothetical protein
MECGAETTVQKHPLDVQENPSSIGEDTMSRTIELELDASAGHLGSVPTEIREGAHRASFRQLGRWGAQANVLHIENGVYETRPATLFAFEFRFLFESGSISRFTWAEVRVTFLPHQQSDPKISPGTSHTTVNHFIPCLIRGDVTPVNRSNRIEISASASGPAPAGVQPGVAATVSRGEEFVREYRMEISGEKWTSDEELYDDNMVIWTLSENSRQGDGIPKALKVGVLVQHGGGPLEGTVEFKARTRSGLSLFGWPWSKPNPVIFRPTAAIGVPLGLHTFDELKEEHWRQLADFPGLVTVGAFSHGIDGFVANNMEECKMDRHLEFDPSTIRLSG